MNKRFTCFVFILATMLSGCMTYNNIPEPDSRGSATSTVSSKTLNYKIDGSSLFAGPMAIRNIIASQSYYSAVSPAEKDITSGDYLHVDITQSPPSIPAVAFGYLSLATLTILPFWSTHDGSVLTYTLYRDGKPLRSKEYVIGRETFVWILMLPVAWVNLMTPSEEEAFAACTKDFLNGNS